MTFPPGGAPFQRKLRQRPSGPRRYAADTSVPVERSRAELETIIRRYGADAFVSGWDGAGATIGFRLRGRFIRIALPLPSDADFGRTPTGRTRHARAAIDAAREQAHRQRWRALVLVVKAKLEAVIAGVSTVEQEFLAWTLLPDGRTVGDAVAPAVADAYASGRQPALLLGPAVDTTGNR